VVDIYEFENRFKVLSGLVLI